jgi:hypothetical protein
MICGPKLDHGMRILFVLLDYLFGLSDKNDPLIKTLNPCNKKTHVNKERNKIAKKVNI